MELSEFTELTVTLFPNCEYCVSLLEKLIEYQHDSNTDKLKFLSEQLQLMTKKREARRYSPALLATCVLWDNTSPC